MSTPLEPLERRHLWAGIFASYFSIVTGLLIPAAIAYASYRFNQNQLYVTERQYCVTKYDEYTNRTLENREKKDISDPERGARDQAIFADIAHLNADCHAVGIDLSEIQKTDISAISQNTRSPQVRDAAIDLLKSNQRLTGAPSSALQAALYPPPRIYINVVDEAQIAQAAALRARLQQTQLDNRPLIIPRIRLEESSDNKNTLLCFTKDDCDKAQGVVDLLNSMLQTPTIHKDDRTSHPEQAAGNRPLHYELWFAPGPIQLRA
jgi:hypothetical protein